MSKPNLFFRIRKVDEAQRLVFGIATAEVMDKSREICNYEGTVPYYKAWSDSFAKATDGKSLGNVREMHDNKAVGKVTEIFFDDDAKSIEICAKVVEESSWQKVVEGVLTGFSQGGQYVKTWKDKEDPTITHYIADPSEVSLVDNPCLATATFEYIKADGATEMRKFVTVETPVVKDATDKAVQKELRKSMKQTWSCSDGKAFEKVEDAYKHQAMIDAGALAKDANDAIDAINKKLDGTEGNDPGDETKPDPEKSGEPDKEPVKEPPADDKVSQKVERVKFEKGLYDVGRAASMLQDMAWMLACLESEAAIEGDDSPQPGKLKGLMDGFAEFLQALCAEEVGELLGKSEGDTMEAAEKIRADHADALAKFVLTHKHESEELAKAATEKFGPLVEALQKAGRRHSASDAGKIAEVQDHVDDMGAHLHKMRKMHKDMSATTSEMGSSTHSEHVAKLGSHLDRMDKCMGKAEKTVDGMNKCVGALGVESKKAAEAGDLAKVAPEAMQKLEADNAALTNTVGTLTTSLQGLQKRLETVEAQPASAGKRPSLHVVEKGNELREPEEVVDAVEKSYDPMQNGLSPEQARARIASR